MLKRDYYVNNLTCILDFVDGISYGETGNFVPVIGVFGAKEVSSEKPHKCPKEHPFPFYKRSYQYERQQRISIAFLRVLWYTLRELKQKFYVLPYFYYSIFSQFLRSSIWHSPKFNGPGAKYLCPMAT